MIGDTVRLPEDRCPKCGGKLDAATGAESGPGPEAGDLSVCIHCLAMLQFDPNLRLKRLTDDEFEALPEEARTGMLRAQTVMRRAKHSMELVKEHRAKGR